MKTKQVKEEVDKSTEEETVAEPKTRARKKATDTSEEDRNKPNQDEPKTSKEPKKAQPKKAIAKKRPLGIRKTLRSKKVVATKDKLKNVIKQGAKRGRKPAIKTEPSTAQEKETVPLIPASEIKKEPTEEATSNSRSSSPKTAGRRPRQSSDLAMMKSVLGDSPSSLVTGPRTSPYSMRSERSNSPSQALRSAKPRKVKNNLLNEVVMKEQKKRRRLLSDSKVNDSPEGAEDKKLKRGRSCSRDGSEISKCSDVTESDISLSETLSNDADSKELKKQDKSKTELDVDIENSLQISTSEKVPSPEVAFKTDTKPETEPASIVPKNKRKPSLNRSSSIDSDNNNCTRQILETISSSMNLTTENDTLSNARSSILSSMSQTFNSKEVYHNIRKARRGRKVAAAGRTAKPGAKPTPLSGTATVTSDAPATVTSITAVSQLGKETQETSESLSKEIELLISNLDKDSAMDTDETQVENTSSDPMTKTVAKFYGVSKPLCDNNIITSAPETAVTNEKNSGVEGTPTKNDDSENIKLHYDDDPADKTAEPIKTEIPYRNPGQSIDKLMDRLKEFEEFDKKRQRQESETKPDPKSVMVTNDVVLITKSGAESNIKPLKDIQSIRSPERPLQKENFLSCFENNSAISIVKRDHARKSIDLDLPNSVTLIKRNSISARKESTGSNNSRESTDAISIFEKSLGKDVTLTEIRKSVDKPSVLNQVDLHQLATLHPNPTNQLETKSPRLGVVLDTKQISITTRMTVDAKVTNDVSKRVETATRKSSESGTEQEATMEKIKSPPLPVKITAPPMKSPSILAISRAPVSSPAVKSPNTEPMEAEPLAPPLAIVKDAPADVPTVAGAQKEEEEKSAAKEEVSTKDCETKVATEVPVIPEKKPVDVEPKKEDNIDTQPSEATSETKEADSKISESADVAKPGKSPEKNKQIRKSTESQPGPSNQILETPENQKHKEDIFRKLGLLTHKAANEAKIEKAKEKERLYNSSKNKATKSGDYTGTLKTIIKLSRGSGERDRKKFRSSLKMTFKSKNRGGRSLEPGDGNDEADTYYTIERREGGANSTTDGGHRKTYSNRLNNHEHEATELVSEPSKEPTASLVIPEKASSFSIHPGRLCMDQCFYCGGKFGLFDTPCHIAQMKSGERQRKVLANEEKLTIDSCLCDACYRHVDRRANCPSYRKRPVLKQPCVDAQQQNPDKPRSPPLEEESSDEAPATAAAVPGGRPAQCHTAGCGAAAERSIRRKWLIKCRTSVNKLLKLEGDYPGLHTIPLCSEHYRALAPLMACQLCRCRLTRHHNVHTIHHAPSMTSLLARLNIPVQFGERPVLCKPCREYCLLLQRAPHPLAQDLGDYRRRLLQIHNVEMPPESENDAEDTSLQDDNSLNKQQKKKNKTKSKRKSTDPEKPGEVGDRKSSEGSETDKIKEESNDSSKSNQPLEEDIESLISTNKIRVPGAHSSDHSDTENMDLDALVPVDKQTELQYLLQKQNNPTQFIQPSLTKHKSLIKLNAGGIIKPGQQQRIADKNAKKIHKIGQIITQKEKGELSSPEAEMYDFEKHEGMLKNISLNDECTIESIPNKRPADITQLKSKWQMSESFTQVKKNLSELSKKLTVTPSEKSVKKLNELKYSNPVKRLETNPSISVRELFPGEEEMNLQGNVEFNNVKGVTPEGWEKCNTTIQYDVETKRLWTELQRPYGNQSSFLRHLVLLEKYFRSGDLVLSHNAAPHAANYSDSVQSRLRAYDNVVTDAPRRSEPSISLIEFRKQKPAVNGKSLLKTNQKHDESKKPIMPPPGLPKPKSKDGKSKKTLPPELIAINTPSKGIQNVLHNIQQLVKDVTASDPTEVATAPLPPPPKFEPPKYDTPPKFEPPKFDMLPKYDTPPKFDAPRSESTPKEKSTPKSGTKKQKTTSKPWRPTLMPITPENLARIATEPPQPAVDGRRLPSLVQVMSAGQRYHITLHDYNKMCVMRREKLQQLGRERPEVETIVTEINPHAMLGNGGSVRQTVPVEKPEDRTDMTQITNAATMLKNVGLKNITIAPIPAKTSTVTSLVPSSSPSLLVTSTPIKMPQFGSSVSITSETIMTPSLSTITSPMFMPKIPKSLTVIPQTIITGMPMLPLATTMTGVPPAGLAPGPAEAPRP